MTSAAAVAQAGATTAASGAAHRTTRAAEATGPALPAVVTSAVKVGDRRVRRRRATAARGGLAGVRRALGAAVDAQSVSYVNNYA